MLALDSCFFLLQTIYVFGFGVSLFIDADQGTGGKWGLWILHKLVLTGVYGVIVFMYHSRWRDRLPGNWLHFRCIIIYVTLPGAYRNASYGPARPATFVELVQNELEALNSSNERSGHWKAGSEPKLASLICSMTVIFY
jgi:hypothetical protein